MAAELVTLPPAVENLPDPKTFGEILLERLNGEIQRVRAQRGPVVDAADTFALIRSLKGFAEVMTDYVRKMQAAAKVALQEVEEELMAAVGEQDGIPSGSLTVPDTDGTDIRLTIDNKNEHFIDLEALKDAVAAAILTMHDAPMGVTNLAIAAGLADDEDRPAAVDNLTKFLATMMGHAMDQLIETGTFKPQVTKVRALAKAMAGNGDDQLAAILTRAISTKKMYAGVKVDRTERK